MTVLTDIERQERIATASWLREVQADPRFAGVIEGTKQELADALEMAERELLEATLKKRSGRFWLRLQPRIDAVHRLRMASNILDMLLLHLQYTVEDGTIQHNILSRLKEG